MTVAVSLDRRELTVPAGQELACETTVRNSGQVVDQFTVEVLGDAAEWSRVEPELVNLLPGTEATLRVVFAPPRSSEVLAGTRPFGIRVASREDPEGSVVEEGEITVEPFTGITTELYPVSRHGSRHARYRLIVDNEGNFPTDVELIAEDPEDRLRLELRPSTLRTQPGTATLVKVKATPHKQFLKGPTQTLPFRVAAQYEQEPPVTADGVMLQEQLIPKWLLPALVALAVLIGVLAALWFAVLKPAVKSVATEQAQKQVAAANTAASKANKAADKANKAAGAAAGNASGAGAKKKNGKNAKKAAGAGGSTAAGAGRSAAAVGGRSAVGGAAGFGGGRAAAAGATSFRIATKAAPVTGGSFKDYAFTAPKKKGIAIGDVVLQNPRGDAGLLKISIGKKVLLVEGLENFRDLDYHYVDPLQVKAGGSVVVSVNCRKPGSHARQCTPSVSFSGQLVPAAPSG